MTSIKSIFHYDAPRVFTIEPAQNFLKVFAKALLNDVLEPFGELVFSDTIVLLPTRRAARVLANEFLEINPNLSIILPRIRTLGDIDPEEMALAELGNFDMSQTVSPLHRQFRLASLIGKLNENLDWASDKIAALNAADALADLLESAELTAIGEKGPDWSKLDDLIEDSELAQHFEISRQFLKIVTEYWPAHLKELGLIDPATKQRLSIEALARNWQVTPPKTPIFIAGSTGSIPATRILMKTVAGLEKGCVILPGLDKEMGERDFARIKGETSHPQRIMFETIQGIGQGRDEIQYFPSDISIDKKLLLRRQVLNAALTPKESTADWLKTCETLGYDEIDAATCGLSLIEAQNEETEAEAIALLMRHSLEIDETCALVTPDKNIARRVASKLKRWEINIDTSSGQSFYQFPLGSFVRAVCEFIKEPALPINLMNLVSHPFAKFGLSDNDRAKGAAGLDIAVLRGATKAQDLETLLKRAESLSENDWRFHAQDGGAAIKVLKKISDTFVEIEKQRPTEFNVETATRFLLNAMEIIAKNENCKSQYIWAREDGQSAASFFGNLLNEGSAFDIDSIDEALEIILQLLATINIRSNNTHPKLAILGPLESRLLHFDKFILAGLDEGVWPQKPQTDPFLSRPMRDKLGLLSKDLRLGQQAHDFSQLCAHKNVILTRAKKRGGAPSVPSRWLWRLKTLLAGAIGEKDVMNALSPPDFDPIKLLGEARSQQGFNYRDAIPYAHPPIEARPKILSATQIENLIRDPYHIYVEKILALRPIDALGGEISSKERGSALHDALENLAVWRNEKPEDFASELSDKMREKLLEYGFSPDEIDDEMHFLKPTIDMIVADELARSETFPILEVEKKFIHNFIAKSGEYQISARIDRIDIDKKGNAEIWDYKTGTVPTNKKMNTMFSPQMPICAYILEKEKPFGIKKITNFGHIKIGNNSPDFHFWRDKELEISDIIENTETTLIGLFDKFADIAMPYNSKPRAEFLYKSQSWEDKYDRLARRKEWADGEDEGGFDE